MLSGVVVSPEAVKAYEDIRKHKSAKYLILTITDSKEITVETKGDRKATYGSFLKLMKTFENECRYIIFDYPVASQREGLAGVFIDRLLLISWCPCRASIRQKTLFASSYRALVKAFDGIYKSIQACDFEELSQKVMEDNILRF
ncbi:actin depolymerizing factor-like [Tropilaelaps mercedesae]|uniref:Actin depolymerizing factor-like n=1 Tax=Tropilaelaps mercedesae TaxID=418985 RepID=A0A1V9XF52_9ACAR|nr:actin depolymerizing factor-like [Tropilaelaps mercedesae]